MMSRFLSYLAVERRVSASTQNQALAALLFLYGEVLEMPVGWLDALVRAKRSARVPVVLTKPEVRRVLAQLKGHDTVALVVGLLYGTGMRLLEVLRLRVKDVDFAKHTIVVCGGKGDRDRVTVLPERLAGPLLKHLADVRTQHEHDVVAGAGWVELPGARCEVSECGPRVDLAVGLSCDPDV
jgi:integrase